MVSSSLERAIEIMDRLRSPGGCPWDAEQTHESLTRYLLEETYEVIEAIESKDNARVIEELGDLLYQVLFHAQIAKERGRFTIALTGMRPVSSLSRPWTFGFCTCRSRSWNSDAIR